MRLVLIRHGETAGNRRRQYIGVTDQDLNARGFSQARNLRRRFHRLKVDDVYSSDRRRAARFARLVFPGRRVRTTAGLREMDFGVMEGLTYRDGMAKYPKAYGNWLTDPARHRLPRAERMADFKKRVLRALKDIVASQKNGTVAVVSHAGPIRLMINRLVRENFWGTRVPPAGVHLIDFRKGRGKLVPVRGKSHG
ncbi:MAG TPA: histidine phosphatase family protein [Elusimicrobiota bacterium]|nr:histidine phosphatase family protein [Elusimicrobiota bacterium]